MDTAQIGGLVRTILAALAGLVAGQGWVDNDTAASVAGALGTLFVAGWSLWSKRTPKSE